MKYEDTSSYSLNNILKVKGNINYAQKPELQKSLKGALRSVKARESELRVLGFFGVTDVAF